MGKIRTVDLPLGKNKKDLIKLAIKTFYMTPEQAKRWVEDVIKKR